eukprot:GHUV01029770.1.p1 GENE.GHUV01029770.1~~GHUV01029770.1.p1  ORF type:complete len:222 (+),score=77.41 GHUV01029770.1:355-1020(+)
MAEYKNSIEKLMFLHFTVLIVKIGWLYTADHLAGTGFPQPVLGMLVGEVALCVLYSVAKLGTVKESLPLLKLFNIVQSVLTATQVLSGWVYHQGTATEGVPTYQYAHAVAKALSARYPAYSIDTLGQYFKTLELFLDLTLVAFLVMGTFVSHKMIVEKMEMKKDKRNVKTDRKDAQKGGSDDDSEDADDAPQAVPLQEQEKPKIAKAAAGSKASAARRRHA